MSQFGQYIDCPLRSMWLKSCALTLRTSCPSPPFQITVILLIIGRGIWTSPAHALINLNACMSFSVWAQFSRKLLSKPPLCLFLKNYILFKSFLFTPKILSQYKLHVYFERFSVSSGISEKFMMVVFTLFICDLWYMWLHVWFAINIQCINMVKN